MQTNKGYLLHIWHRVETISNKDYDGNNHCYAAKRGWVVEKNRLPAQQVQKAFSWVLKEVRKLFCGSRSMFRLLYIYL